MYLCNFNNKGSNKRRIYEIYVNEIFIILSRVCLYR